MVTDNMTLVEKWGAIARIVSFETANTSTRITFKRLEPFEEFPIFDRTIRQLQEDAKEFSEFLQEQLPEDKELKLEFITHVDKNDVECLKARICIYKKE